MWISLLWDFVNIYTDIVHDWKRKIVSRHLIIKVMFLTGFVGLSGCQAAQYDPLICGEVYLGEA